MGKAGEIAYLRNIGEDGVRHAVNRPFSDVNCGEYLIDIGTVMSLLPRPPVRLLDLGCGTGWTSVMFARAGYDVVGVDISSDMLDCAEQNRLSAGLDNLSFHESDYEELDFREEFDAVVFYDSLHHAVDESLAMRRAYESLKSGGVCVTSEPGRGHEESAHTIEAVCRFGVTEKDMPPDKIAALGRQVGYRNVEFYPHCRHMTNLMFRRVAPAFFKRSCLWLACKLLGTFSRAFPVSAADLILMRDLTDYFSTIKQTGCLVRMLK